MNIQCPSQWIKSILISFIFICITPFSIAEASSDEQSSLVNIFQVEALSNSGTPYTIVDQFLFTSETINDYYPIGDLEHQVVVKKWDLTKSQLIDTYQFNYIGSSDYEPRLKAYDVSMNALIFDQVIYLINEDRTIELPEEIKGNQSITERFASFRVIKDGSIYVLDKEWNLYIYSIRTEQMRHWELPVEWESKINDLIFFDVDPITNEWIFYQQNQLNIVQGDDPTIVQTIPLDHLDMQWPNVAFDEKKREIRAVDGSSRVLFKRTAAGGYEELEIDPVQKMLEEYSDKPTGSFYTYNDQRRYSISIEKEKWKSSPYEIRLYDDWFDTNTVLYRAEDPALSYSEFARGDTSYLSFFTYKTDQEGFFKRSTMLVDYSNLSYHVEDVQLERKFEGYDVLQPIPLNVIVKQGNHTRTVRNPEIQWDISDPSIAKIEGSFLVFLKEGTVTLKTTILGHLVEQTFSTNQIFQTNPEVSYNEVPVKEVVLLEGTTELTVFLNEWIQLDKQTEDSIRLTKDGVPVAFQVRHWRNEIVLETEYPYVEGTYELWIDGIQSVKKTTVEPVHWPIEVVIKPTGKLLDPPLAEKQHILFQ